MRTAVVTAANATGRSRTFFVIVLQRPPLPLARPKNGTRSRSTLSPSTERTAGRKVREPTMEMNTTRLTPNPMEMNTGLLVRARPAKESITVTPA